MGRGAGKNKIASFLSQRNNFPVEENKRFLFKMYHRAFTDLESGSFKRKRRIEKLGKVFFVEMLLMKDRTTVAVLASKIALKDYQEAKSPGLNNKNLESKFQEYKIPKSFYSDFGLKVKE